MKYSREKIVDKLVDLITNSSDCKIDHYHCRLPKYNIQIWIANGIPCIAFEGGEFDHFPLNFWDKVRIYFAVKQASINKFGDMLTKE